jgi:tRNA pseudouridine13 synthase
MGQTYAPMPDLPRQLSDFRPAAGRIKDDYTDFIVEELPLYPPDGNGTHTYFLLEKSGLSTMQAVHDLARALGVRRHEIGFAGQKDARAVTRQWMSVEHLPPERVAALALPRLRVLAVTRHGNKLRLGHLKGNRFVIRVRQGEPERLADLQDALAQLARCGVPNYFGGQRFGYRGDTWALGQAILHGQTDEALDLLLGRPTNSDYGDIRLARQHYDRGQYAAAARAWPAIFQTERRALKALLRSGADRRRALAAVDRSTKRFYVSAYQSHLFNRVLAARLPYGLGRMWLGDLAWLHASGAVFRVEEPVVEQPRADRFEISPTGPLFGYRMTQPSGQPAELEAQIMAGESLPPDELHRTALRVKGARRPLRFCPAEAELSLGADDRGTYLELRFVLPRGCYATALLRELFSLGAAAGIEADDEETETSAP